MKFTEIIKKAAGTAALKLKECSPEIAIGAGIVSIVAGTVVACVATKKYSLILDEAKEDLERVDEAVKEETEDEESNNESGEKTEEAVTYSKEDAKKDKKAIYIYLAKKAVVNYAPSAALTILGIVLILWSHKIMKSRNLALTAAYTALQTAYTNYRNRVIKKEGEEADKYYKYGIKVEQKEVTKTNEETDTEETVLEEVEVIEKDYLLGSPYARFFDETTTTEFVENDLDNLYNFNFLKGAQEMFNRWLRERGYVFLNEVYRYLGFEEIPEGQIVGWLDKGDGDGFIDIGIYNCYDNPECAGFMDSNGFQRKIVLDFNVDGPILNTLSKDKKNKVSKEELENLENA